MGGLLTRNLFVAALTLGFILAGAPALAACKLSKIVELPVTMSGLRPIVTVGINGRDARLVADSGAFHSIISPGSAAEYGLKLTHAPYGMTIDGIGGDAEAWVSTVKTFTLAGYPIHNVEFLVGGSETGSFGVLGQNVLGLADVEYDLAGGAVRLWVAKGCEHKVLTYWAGDKPISVMDIADVSVERQTTGTAYVNGVKVRVTFDTGAGTSLLTLAAAARAGVKPSDPGVVYEGGTGGFGRRTVPTWIARFSSFKVGDEEIRNTRLRIGEIGLDGVDMLLGADFFLSHRVYVANSQRRLFFTYNGGPVFNLESHTTTLDVRDQTPRAPPAPAAGAADPTDAEGFSRRGAAFDARQDYVHALADFDRACQMGPTQYRYFYQRGVTRLHNSQPLLAMADFDQALKIKPDDVESLLVRAELRLAGGGKADVVADLDAATQVIAKESNLRLSIARLYGEVGAFDLAVKQYDLWIATHSGDGNMLAAFNGRCWSRALWGKDLDKALSDCNTAVRWAPKVAGVLDSRGLVHLRQGDLDKAIADYDAALALEPKTAWSLYGRGLARQRKGLRADGDADIAAAIALQPKLPELAKQYGVAP